MPTLALLWWRDQPPRLRLTLEGDGAYLTVELKGPSECLQKQAAALAQATQTRDPLFAFRRMTAGPADEVLPSLAGCVVEFWEAHPSARLYLMRRWPGGVLLTPWPGAKVPARLSWPKPQPPTQREGGR